MNQAPVPRAPHPLDHPNQYPEPIGPVERLGHAATSQAFNFQYPNPELFSTGQKPAPHWEEGPFKEENARHSREVRLHNGAAEAKLSRGERLGPCEWKVATRPPRGMVYTYITPAEKAKQPE